MGISSDFLGNPRAQASPGLWHLREPYSGFRIPYTVFRANRKEENGWRHTEAVGKRLARAFHLINVVVVDVAFAWLCSAARQGCFFGIRFPSFEPCRHGCQKLAPTSVMPARYIFLLHTRVKINRKRWGAITRQLPPGTVRPGPVCAASGFYVCKIYTDTS